MNHWSKVQPPPQGLPRARQARTARAWSSRLQAVPPCTCPPCSKQWWVREWRPPLHVGSCSCGRQTKDILQMVGNLAKSGKVEAGAPLIGRCARGVSAAHAALRYLLLSCLQSRCIFTHAYPIASLCGRHFARGARRRGTHPAVL